MAAIFGLARLTGAIVNAAAAAMLIALIVILLLRGFGGDVLDVRASAGLPIVTGGGLLPVERR